MKALTDIKMDLIIIFFIWLGEYNGEVSELEGFAKAAGDAINKGDNEARSAALNAVTILCDFMETKFTSYFEKILLRETLFVSLNSLEYS